MRSSADLASSPLSMVTAVQRRPEFVARHRREHMRADRPFGIADRDRDLNRCIEHDAATVRCRLMRVAAHVKLLRRAADVDRDRLERELRLARRLGGVGLPRLGRLGRFLGGGGGVELRFRVGLGGVELGRQFRGLGGGLLLEVLGPRLGLVRLGGGERLVGVGEFGVGAGLEPLQLAQRRRQRRRLARRCRGGFLRLVGRLGGLGRLAGERLGLGRRGRDGLPFGTNSAGWENSTGSASSGEMITRIPIHVLSNSFSAKPKGIRTQPCEAA